MKKDPILLRLLNQRLNLKDKIKALKKELINIEESIKEHNKIFHARDINKEQVKANLARAREIKNNKRINQE